MYKPALLSVAVAAAAVPSLAQTSDDSNAAVSPLETLVVIASRTETPRRQLGSSVSVLDEQALEQLGTPSLVEALRTLPSVAVTNDGGFGKASSVRVRGEAGYRTRVRVDGVEVTDPTVPQASTQVQHLLNANLSRVELLRGPQGMMYGADAGGVLNVTTDRVERGLETGLSLEGGRYDSRNASGHIGAGGETGNVYVSAARAETDGFNARLDDESGETDGYENTTVHARGAWTPDPDMEVQLVVRDTSAETEFDNCGFPATNDCLDKFDQRNARASLTHGNDHGKNTLAYARTDVDRINYADGEVSYQSEGEIGKWTLNGEVAMNEAHTLAYGIEHRREQVSQLERDQQGAYFEYRGGWADRFYLSAGVRHDDNEDFGGHTTYRLSGAYLVPIGKNELKFKSSLGTGYRAPSLSEIDYNRSQEMALPALAEEQSRGAEAGVEYLGREGLRLEAVLFDQRIDDEIYFDSTDFVYRQGEQRSESRGIELVGEWPLGAQWALTGNATLLDTEAADGNPRAIQPEQLVHLGTRYRPLAELTLSLNVRAARERHHDEVELGNYEIVNVSVRYGALEWLELSARVENLTDEDYIESPGYHTAGAAGYAGATLTF